MEEAQIRLKLRVDQGSVNFPREHLIGYVEDVVDSIIGLEGARSQESA
jgi:hypothetical protein